jgi:hypothetical protein
MLPRKKLEKGNREGLVYYLPMGRKLRLKGSSWPRLAFSVPRAVPNWGYTDIETTVCYELSDENIDSQ